METSAKRARVGKGVEWVSLLLRATFFAKQLLIELNRPRERSGRIGCLPPIGGFTKREIKGNTRL